MRDQRINIIGFMVVTVLVAVTISLFLLVMPQQEQHHMPYLSNIVNATAGNQDFRRVLFTGTKSQLVVMSIPPGGEAGEETHAHVEQILYIQSGTGVAILDGKSSPIGPGDVVMVTPGTLHNVRNTGIGPLKITTTYAPPNHIDGRVHHTKADADADLEDEAFGEK